MVSKKNTKILTELLDLEGVKVISHRLHDGIGMILQTESKKTYSSCPNCGTISYKLHQNHRHLVKDLPFGEKPIYLEVNRRQFKCSKCKKPFSEDLDFVRKKRTYTKRLANQTIQEVLDSDIHSVASRGIVTTDEIERMLKDTSEDNNNLKPLGLERLGIDEIALVKGKGNYCAVLIDLDTSKLIAILSWANTRNFTRNPYRMGIRDFRTDKRSKHRFVARLQELSNRTNAKCSSSGR